ncbi:ATP-binding protein [Pseudoduganella buxea]|uniref:Uncharacterized protein n=1 Tax=Pseudoduganella buxea TaxID=1949069 RepID=A0A6I3T9C8_9BURK|nr:ATP-binding protein [Pseudoduganella buxea]MTV56267.1 hypothetical protein [Pseudoduganella buxea]GGC25336.1 hypothetical protein GCM10011572_53410 [Pseudoduganella buxea]
MSIFSVPQSKLTAYDAGQGIDLMKKLLWAEAWRVGIPRQDVSISEAITVADGGIDASVNTTTTHGSILIAGHTHYQIKTGESFKPWQKAQIRTELFGEEQPKLQFLGLQTRRGLEQGFAYSLVTTGHDLTTEQRDQAKDWLAEYFSLCGFPAVSIHVLGAGELAGMLELHPSLCLEINGLSHIRFQTVGSWRANSDMTPSLSLGLEQKQFIEQLRATLEDSSIQHIRIVGEPGIGKTRLVLEAVAGNESVSASTMYFRQASDFQDQFLNDLMREGQPRSLILVIDECEDRERSEIWSALKDRPGVKLVTIDHGPGTTGGVGMQTLQAPLLEREQVESILRTYLPGNQLLSNWALWCEGSARVAHALGENLRDHPEDILRSPGTVQIWDRFISGYGSDVDGGRAKTVLMHIALFEMFGYRKPVQEEADFVSSLVQKTDPTITRSKFDQIVHYYLQRRILQGDRTLRIVPKALRIYLWREWWQNFGASADVLEMLNTMPKSLHRWFMHSFVYAQDVKHALSVVQTLLDPGNGLFADKAVMASEVGAGFISVLAQSAPAETLTLLRSILKWTDDDLTAIRRERHSLARALSFIAVWQPYFRASARILARLSFGESSTYSNNCRGTLKDLFMPFGAPTQTPFEERVPLALEMLADQKDFVREIGLDTASACLKVRGRSRIIDVEFQGARPEIVFWQPKLWTELTEPWSKVIDGLLKSRLSVDVLWKNKVDKILIERTGDLLKTNVLHELCIQTLTDLATERKNFDQIYQLLTNIGRYPPKELAGDVLEKIAQLKTHMDGADFHSRVLRHVLSAIWDDDIEEVEDGGTERRAQRIRSLAEDAVADLRLLRVALPELFANSVVRQGSQFGEYLAAAFGDDRFDQEMLSYATKHSEECQHPFLWGYLRGVFGIDPARWEALALAFLANPALWIILAVVDSGASPAVFERLLEIHENSSSDTSWMCLLGRDPIPALLGQDGIRRAIQAVLDKNAIGYRTAMQMAEWTLCKTDDPLDLPVAIAVLAAGADHDADVMSDHYWGLVAKRLLKLAPEYKIELFRLLVQGTKSFGAISSGGKISRIAFDICKEHPVETWPIVAQALLSDKSYVFRIWLGDDGIRGDPVPPAITAFKPADIFAWIDEDRVERAHKMTDVLPKTLEMANGGELTRDFLDRYFDIEGVGESVMFRFGSGSFSGPRSLHLAQRRSNAQRWMAQVGISIVGEWLDEYVQKLSKDIENEKIMEERSLR